MRKNPWIVTLFLLLCASVLFFEVSMPGLYEDVVNPDGLNWHQRTSKFMQALDTGNFRETYQAYHPGISLMWISGPVLQRVGNELASQGRKLYAPKDFLIYDYYAKISLIAADTLLFFISLILLSKLINKKFLVVFALLGILEPYALGERRLYHLDYLMTGFMTVSFLAYFIYFFRSPRWFYPVLGSFFLAAAVLTKTTALILGPVVFLMFIFSSIPFKKRLAAALIALISGVVFIFLMFPAFWVNPLQSIPEFGGKILSGVTSVGAAGSTESGTSQSWYFYIKGLPYLLSPVAILLTAFSFIFLIVTTLKKIKKREDLTKDHAWLLAVFSLISFLIFIIILSIASKKSERYIVALFPFLFVLAAYGISRLKILLVLMVSLVFALSLIPQYQSIYPYFYSYGNPLLGGVKGRYEAFQSGPFGVATYAVQQAIRNDREDPSKFYAVAAYKSYVAISKDPKVMYTPDCYANYYVARPLSKQPDVACTKAHYYLWKTIRVGNMDFWYIYKK